MDKEASSVEESSIPVGVQDEVEGLHVEDDTHDNTSPPEPTPVMQKACAPCTKLSEVLKKHARILFGGVSIILLCGAIIASVVLYEKSLVPTWFAYTEGYRLVPDTISQSAMVVIALPDEAGVVTPKQVTFTPELRGDFVLTEQEKTLLFKPAVLPEIGSYYTVALAYGSTSIRADFKVAEDPRVVSILPSSDAEVHEDTKVSVMFNRPMVSLSTRGEVDKMEVPVRLEPEVPGVWKWKSTRLLQFIPEEDLVRATQYTVTVDEGFHSLDGVSVKGFTHTFTTRTLKQDVVPTEVRFNESLVLTFNQPVDLARTANEITFMQDGEAVEPIIEYAKKKMNHRPLFGLVLFGASDEIDTSKILIRPRKDSHGREGYWDFESSYTLTINKKYPTEGDIVDTAPLTWSYAIPAVLSSLTAYSTRSDQVTQSFFDPQGELVATFYEPVNVHETIISVPGLKSVRYGTQCVMDKDDNPVKEPGTKECKKEENKHELRITLDPQIYTSGKSAQVSFDRVVSDEGSLVLNNAPIVQSIQALPTLQVLRTIPEEGATRASLTRLIVCSNTPLKQPESVRDALATDGYVVFPNGPWSQSYRVGTHSEEGCGIDEFQTDIQYGLHPERAYTLSLRLEDAFGAREDRQIHVMTEPAPSTYTRFHSLQKEYNVTIPSKTRLTYAVENLPFVTAHMCKVSASAMLKLLEEQSLGDGLPHPSVCTEARTAMIDVPDTYWVNNYFYFDLKEYFSDTRGHYIITFTHPNYRNEKGAQLYERTLLTVSELTVAEKRINWYNYGNDSRVTTPTPQSLYWVLGARTLLPIPGATVVSYEGAQNYDTERKIHAGPRGTTGSDGVVRLPASPDTTGAVVMRGDDTAIVSAYTDTLQNAWSTGGESRTYLYTDRPIYRPGDTVYVRGIDRVGYDQVWSVTEGYTASVQVTNSRGDTIATQSMPVSRYGTFDTAITIPKDAPLGRYSIQAMQGYGGFDVEEYVGAPFKVTVEPKNTEYIAGDTAQLIFDAQYYFDMPVADAEVEYTVLAQDYYFDRYTDEYFQFGAGWYSCYWCGYGDEFVTRGTVALDANGKASLDVPLSFEKYFDDSAKEGSKLFTVIARVQDKSGREVTGQNTVVVHRGEYYLGIKTDPYFAGVGQPVAIRVKSVNTQGAPIALDDMTFSIHRVEWESYKRREVDGGYYWHSEEKRTIVDTRNIGSDKSGNQTIPYTFTEPGEYEISVVRTDARGNAVTGVTRMYVSGEGDVSVQPTNNETLAVTADKTSYKVGEQGTILMQSPFKTARALVTVERGDIYEYWSTPITSSLVTQTIPIRDRYAPNVYASVLLVGPGPEVKYGNVELRVDIEKHELAIEAVPNKRAYLPGEDVELVVRTKDSEGRPVSAEVSVAIVDLSVLALRGNPKKDPVSFFYGSLSLGVSTAHSAKNILIQEDIPVGTKGGGGGEDLERRKRGTFKDTAYWQANVVTNTAGEATVRFTLPDNLTTWQVESLGVTTDTRVGVGYTEFTSKKKLMAIPLRPRFVVPGDTMSIGMQIANNTDADVTVQAHIESPTLRVIDIEKKTVRVQAGTQSVVYFEAEAPRDRKEGAHAITLYAQGEGMEDAVEQSIPILADKTFEVVATAGVTTAPYVFESVYIPNYALAGEGELMVRAQPTLVTSLLDAVKDMSGYPYGCSEQIASKLASLATIRRVGELFGSSSIATVQTIVFEDATYTLDEAIGIGLRDLLGRQTYGGGFSFYTGTEPSVYLTTEVLSSLTVLRDAGYVVPDDVFARAGTYIIDELARHDEYGHDSDFVARVAYALSSPYISTDVRKRVVARVGDIVRDTLALERLSTTALGYLAIATYRAPYERSTSDVFYHALENRLVVDARGAYVQSRPDDVYSWFESPEKNTALFVQTIVDRGGAHPTLDNLLRWLERSKREEGGWGSTNATFTVLDAVLRMAEVRGENRVAYTLDLFLNSESVATHVVSNDNLFDVFTYVFPLERFARERLHEVGLAKTNDVSTSTVYYDMQLRYALPPDMVPPRDEGITVERTLSARNSVEPIVRAGVGDLVTGTLEITVPEIYHAVSIESFVPAGFEIVNFSSATEESRDLVSKEDMVRDEFGNDKTAEYSSPYTDPQAGPHPFPTSYEELHDDRVFAFAEEVQPGTYTYTYTLRALVPGTYRHMPATVREMYTPEVYGRTEGGVFTIMEK